MKKFVITHAEMGIYLGNYMGLGFWTLMDSADQPMAVVFDNKKDAYEHIRSWDERNNPYNYNLVSIEASGRYASIPALIDAGLKSLLGNMIADFLKYTDVDGSA